MDLTPTSDQEAFRAELRAWLADHSPDESLRAHSEDLTAEVVALRRWQAKLAGGRWIGVTWPEEYGGRGAGALHHFIVQEELARAQERVAQAEHELVERHRSVRMMETYVHKLRETSEIQDRASEQAALDDVTSARYALYVVRP